MNIELHNNAIENFNEKFEELLFELKVNPYSPPNQKKFETDVVVDKIIDETEIIGEPILSLTNMLGDETAKFFMVDGEQIGYYDNDYLIFSRLCENIQRVSVIKEYISKKYLINKAFDWVSNRYRNRTTLKFWDYLKPILEDSIEVVEVIIPLYMTQIESQFKIGNVEFTQITKTYYDSWYTSSIKDKLDKDRENIRELFEKERNKHQGYAAAIINVTAEIERAREVAFEEVERAVDILRIYDPANLHPLANSYLTLYGKENINTSKHFVIKNEKLETISESRLERNFRMTQINNSMLLEMNDNGLNTLSDLLKRKELNDFQKSFLNALQIYSNNSLSKTITDRIVSILVSLESILLKGNEPIQQNVGERMAFAITNNGKERKDIVDNLKTIYDLRSRYIHHAYEITTDKLNDLQFFMMNAWRFHISLIKNIYKIKTKDDLIERLDNLKYYGNR